LALALVPATARAGSIQVGDRAPAFTLPAWNGGSVALESLRGRTVCVDFWASWCAPCRTALPALDAVPRPHPHRTLVSAGIHRRRAAADRSLAERLPGGTVMTLVHDPGGALLSRFGASGMPALYVIDPTGTVRLVESGWTNDRLAEIEHA